MGTNDGREAKQAVKVSDAKKGRSGKHAGAAQASGEASPTKTEKGARTRARILEAALRLVRERGYEETTMRAIADEAGVALGNAYYYFASKEHLIQGFYARTHEEHLTACEAILTQEKDFRARLLGVLLAKLDTSMPYHKFAGILFKTAADPASPLNPFSEESRPVRDDATEVFARVVQGSNIKVRGQLAQELPELLWTYQMGIILFWVHDSSQGCARTRKLIEDTVDLVTRLVSLSSVPLMRPLVRRALKTFSELRSL